MNSAATSLDRLHDIVTPPAAPLWPPAPGWYYVIVLGLVIFLVLFFRALVRWQRNRYRREALAELARYRPDLSDSARRIAALARLAELLKRTAITAFSRAEVASLTGPAWFAFLDCAGRTQAFSAGDGATLEAASYVPTVAATRIDDAAAHKVATSVQDWIKRHDPEFAQKETKRTKAGTGQASRKT